MLETQALVSLHGNKFMKGGYKIRDQSAIHFLTFTVVEWMDVFTRKEYRDVLLDSIRFCQDEKGLLLHCWCIMSNHLHLIASAKNHNLSDWVRDFKKFTGRTLIETIANHPGESRKDWMLRVFREQGQANSRNNKNQFWRQDNHPEELYSPAFVFQKLNYIHNNPVEAGIVANPWEYLYSSARDYHETRKCGLLDLCFFVNYFNLLGGDCVLLRLLSKSRSGPAPLGLMVSRNLSRQRRETNHNVSYSGEH